MNIKEYFIGKRAGFYATLAGIVLSLITLIAYVASGGAGDMTATVSWTVFAMLLAGVISAIALIVLKLDDWAAVAMSLFSFLGLLFFIVSIYKYVSAAITGIDSTFTTSFFICTILFVLGLAASLVGFFMTTPLINKIQKIGVPVIAILLGVLLAGTVIAGENSAAINSALGIHVDSFSGGEVEDYYPTSFKNMTELVEAGNKMGEKAMGEGVVLLENDGDALPLKTAAQRKVTFFGVGSVDPVYGGTGSGAVDTSKAPTFKSAFERNSLFSVNGTMWDWYNAEGQKQYRRTMGETGAGVTGVKKIGEAPWSAVLAAGESSFASFGGAAIVVLSRVGGEGSDVPRESRTLSKLDDTTGSAGDTTNGDYLKLSPKEKDLLAGVKAKKDAGVFDSVIVLLNTANQIEADFIQDSAYGIDSALWIGTPGTSGLYAVAELLAGNINPSGSLSDTFWKSHKLNPALANFGVYTYDGAPTGATESSNQDVSYVVYQEGIYLGYRYVETRYEDFVMGKANTGTFDYSAAISYPFGHGLSYTNFTYSNLEVTSSGEGAAKKYTVSVDVTNSGDCDGMEAVQVYLQKPYGTYNTTNGVEAASVELVGFGKKYIKQGETASYSIDIKERQFASYDSENAKTYVITEGDYYLAVGADAHDATNNILAKKGFAPASTANRMDEEGVAALVSDAITLTQDNAKYSNSEATGNKITNQFEYTDWNKYANRGTDKVDYISRADWEGTTPASWDDNVVLHWKDQIKADMDATGRKGETKLPEDNGKYPAYGTFKKDDNGSNIKLRLIDLRVRNEGAENEERIPYDDPLWEQLLDQLTWDECVEIVRYGMRLTGQIKSIEKPQTLDHNGPSGLTEPYTTGKGLANREENKKDPLRRSKAMCYPSNGILAATFNIDLMYDIGDMIGEDALWAGYNGLYGPGSNIHRTPYSGRNFEYYSEDGYLSGIICAYETAGMEQNGLYVYNKHIGLNDQEDLRRGICTWANEQSVREIYMRAFELPITIAGTTHTVNGETITLKGGSGVMTAFNRMGLHWSSVQKGLMTNFLRGECGMTGIAVTDMWYGDASNYMNLPGMILAGTNLVDGSQDAAQMNASKTKHADVAWAMRESLHRILYTVVHSNAMNGVSVGSVMQSITPWWEILLITVNIVLGILLAAGAAWIIADQITKARRKKLKA